MNIQLVLKCWSAAASTERLLVVQVLSAHIEAVLTGLEALVARRRLRLQQQ